MRRIWTPVPVDQWPAPDRSLWLGSLSDHGLLFERGRAAHWSEATRIKYRDGYGRWLAFLCEENPAAFSEPPAARVTPQRLGAYLATMEGKAPYTYLAAVDEIWAVLRTIAPEADHSLLGRAWRRLKKRAEMSNVAKQGRILSSDRLFRVGLEYFEAAATNPLPLTAAIQGRDGLMVAVLALRPLRRRNFADLSMGRSLIAAGDGWHICFEPHETKTGRAIDLPWPDCLNAPLALYLERYRRALLKGETSDRLWISVQTTPLAPHSITLRIKQITERLTGVDISPKLFRDSLATTLAIEDPDHVRTASALLGHATPRTTERYYNQAQSIDAARYYQAMLRDRTRTKPRS